MKLTSLFVVVILGGIFICCGKQASNTQHVDNDKDSALVNDTLTTEENDSILDLGGKSLNDIRFDGWGDKDWLDNEYIRCLRKYIDDYKSGKIKDENLDQYKDKIKGKFVIGLAEPSLLGGLFICFIFVDSPDDMFESWVYSGVDEEKEVVLDYEVRSVMLGEVCSKTIFSVTDMDNVVQNIMNESGIQIHGLLGVPFLRENNCSIDFGKMEIEIAGPEQFKEAV